MPQASHHQGGHPGLRVRDGLVPQRTGRSPRQGHRHRPQIHPGRGVRQTGRREESGRVPRRVVHRGQAACQEKQCGRGVDRLFRVLLAGLDCQRRNVAQEQEEQDRGRAGPDREGD